MENERIEELLIYMKETNKILIQLETEYENKKRYMNKSEIKLIKDSITHYSNLWHNYNNELTALYYKVGFIYAN